MRPQVIRRLAGVTGSRSGVLRSSGDGKGKAKDTGETQSQMPGCTQVCESPRDQRSRGASGQQSSAVSLDRWPPSCFLLGKMLIMHVTDQGMEVGGVIGLSGMGSSEGRVGHFGGRIGVKCRYRLNVSVSPQIHMLKP